MPAGREKYCLLHSDGPVPAGPGGRCQQAFCGDAPARLSGQVSRELSRLRRVLRETRETREQALDRCPEGHTGSVLAAMRSLAKHVAVACPGFFCLLSQTGDLCPVGIVGLRRPTGFGLEGGQLQPLAPGPVVTGLDEGPVLAHVLRAQLPVPLQVFGRYGDYLCQVFSLVTARQLFQLREDTGQKPGDHLPPVGPVVFVVVGRAGLHGPLLSAGSLGPHRARALLARKSTAARLASSVHHSGAVLTPVTNVQAEMPLAYVSVFCIPGPFRASALGGPPVHVKAPVMFQSVQTTFSGGAHGQRQRPCRSTSANSLQNRLISLQATLSKARSDRCANPWWLSSNAPTNSNRACLGKVSLSATGEK